MTALPDNPADSMNAISRIQIDRVTAFMRLLKTFCIVTVLCLCLTACAGDDPSGWSVVDPSQALGRRHLFFLLGGLRITLMLSVASLLVGVVLGLILAILAANRRWFLRRLVRLYVEIVRAVPLFVLLLWVYYALPIMLRSLPPGPLTDWLIDLTDLSPFAAATLALSANAAAFLSEIFRAGIEAIPRGHVEAARSLGMSSAITFRRIVLPQASRRMLPPTVNQFIMTVKDSSLAAAIGLGELTRRATELQTQTYRPMELYTVLAAEYLVILVLLSYAARRIERWVTLE